MPFILNKDSIKNLCQKKGRRVSYLIDQMGVNRSTFDGFSTIRYSNGEFSPIATISEDQIEILEDIFDAPDSEFLIDSEKIKLTCK